MICDEDWLTIDVDHDFSQCCANCRAFDSKIYDAYSNESSKVWFYVRDNEVKKLIFAKNFKPERKLKVEDALTTNTWARGIGPTRNWYTRIKLQIEKISDDLPTLEKLEDYEACCVIRDLKLV